MINDYFHTIKDLVVNFAIVTAYLFLCSQVIFKKTRFGVPTGLSVRLKTGFIASMLGIVLMSFTVSFGGTILDFRQLAIINAALFGGVIPSLIAGVILAVMRLLAFGPISTSSLIASLNILVVSIGVGLISGSRISYWYKWLYSIILGNLLTSIAFFLNLGTNAGIPALIYIIMMSAGGAVTAYLTHFLLKVKADTQRMEMDATIDYLTDLNNHRTFDLVFNSTLKDSLEKKADMSLLMIDIDFFKKINDTHGHVNGDAVLKQAGELLKKTSRSSDTISRNGGEEFSIILRDCPLDEAVRVAEKIRHNFEQHSFELSDGETIKITISIGAASLAEKSDDNMIEQADLALYKAKASGRNQVFSFT